MLPRRFCVRVLYNEYRSLSEWYCTPRNKASRYAAKELKFGAMLKRYSKQNKSLAFVHVTFFCQDYAARRFFFLLCFFFFFFFNSPIDAAAQRVTAMTNKKEVHCGFSLTT